MNENSLKTVQVPAQAVKKPKSVTVFGVLNIVYGGLFILFTPIAIFGYLIAGKKGDVSFGEMMWALFSLIVGFGLTIWLVILGIGLLHLKKWARAGSVMYAWVDIAFILLGIGVDIVILSLDGINPQEGELAELFVESLDMVSLVYPALLLIFMQKAKVKMAFQEIAG
jgi:hypothetical protein